MHLLTEGIRGDISRCGKLRMQDGEGEESVVRSIVEVSIVYVLQYRKVRKWVERGSSRKMSKASRAECKQWSSSDVT